MQIFLGQLEVLRDLIKSKQKSGALLYNVVFLSTKFMRNKMNVSSLPYIELCISVFFSYASAYEEKKLNKYTLNTWTSSFFLGVSQIYFWHRHV
jgi:hypothetical protein